MYLHTARLVTVWVEGGGGRRGDGGLYSSRLCTVESATCPLMASDKGPGR